MVAGFEIDGHLGVFLLELGIHRSLERLIVTEGDPYLADVAVHAHPDGAMTKAAAIARRKYVQNIRRV